MAAALLSVVWDLVHHSHGSIPESTVCESMSWHLDRGPGVTLEMQFERVQKRDSASLLRVCKSREA